MAHIGDIDVISVEPCYLVGMAHPQDLKPAVARSRVLVGVLHAGALASVMIGSALVSSMGGELPVYGPTAEEQSRWTWGNGLTLAGVVLTLLCVALLFFFRKGLGLSLRAAVGVGITTALLAGLLYVFAWGLAMA